MKKIVIVGPGLIGKKHAELVLASSDFELVGLVAPPSPDNLSYAANLNVALYHELEAAIIATQPDGVIISSPNIHHFEQSALALRAGISCLVEKPVTDNLESAREMVRIAGESKAKLLVGHHRTHSPLVAAASTFLNSDTFGKLVAMQGSAIFYKPENYFKDAPWRSVIGGGPLLINLIHEVGLWRTWGGEINSVQAIVTNKNRKFEVEDSATISFEFETGALGSFILSDAAVSAKSWELTAGENKAFPKIDLENAYHFAGNKASLNFPSMKTMTYEKEFGWTEKPRFDSLSVERIDPLQAQLKHFLNVIEGETEPLVSANDGFQNLLVLKAIENAAQTGKTIRLRDFLADQ